MKWNKKYDKCISCGSTEWEHKAKGLCKKCYPLIIKREVIEKWDSNDKTTLISVGGVSKMAIDIVDSSGEIEKAKKSLLQQIDARLFLFQQYNNPNTNATGVEAFLRRIEKITNNISKEDSFYGAVSRYQDNFSSKQIKIIISDLALILINRRFSLSIFDY